ncbi:MAG: hypothetical protein KGK00_07245 [Paracoccaceae bacterium]|nr:hypothetical protein [Paracoccaceae bacterium]MDE3240640.1 hypothetical protein [Paracoccaceae bacterium]
MPFQLSFADFQSGLHSLSEAADRGLSDLWHFPHLRTDVMCQHAKLIGHAGELLVESMLLRHGLVSAALPDTFPVDRVIFHPQRPVGMQIKTSMSARDGAFNFAVSKGYQRSPSGQRQYEPEDFDILALCVLPANVVYFTTQGRSSFRIPCRQIPALQANPIASLAAALKDLGLETPTSVPTPSAKIAPA